METMRPLRSLISSGEALKIIQERSQPLERTEQVNLEEALQRVLAQDLIAEIAVPPFSRAAEDGYAVRAEETIGAGLYTPKPFTLVDVIQAGEEPHKELGPGECIQVATGAPIPQGADAVVRVEDTEREGDVIRISRPVHAGFDIALAGEDIKEGETVLKQGTLLSPSKIGVLAALGLRRVEVYAKPSVAIMPTGDEIVPPGEQLAPGQIYDVNTYTLFSVVKAQGGESIILGSVADDLEAIKERILKALDYDLIALSGGSSVGERDLLMDAIRELGDLHFHGVQVKPGKPTWFATVEGKPVFGLPGYPTSCLSDAYLFLAPALRKMAHLPPLMRPKVRAKLAQRIASPLGREQFFTVKLKEGKVHPAFKSSGAITSMAQADGYIIIPINVDLLERDEKVEVHPL